MDNKKQRLAIQFVSNPFGCASQTKQKEARVEGKHLNWETLCFAVIHLQRCADLQTDLRSEPLVTFKMTITFEETPETGTGQTKLLSPDQETWLNT